MITSIVLTGRHTIRSNSSKKILIDGNVLSIEKEIPFIRYRFESYSDDDYNYIKKIKEQFNRSTHLAEINLSADTVNIVNKLSETIGNIAKYVYVTVTEDIVQSKGFGPEVAQLISTLRGLNIDRIMLKDKSTSLDTVTAKALFKQITSLTGFKEDTMGVCSSPLSFGDMACLTAVRAREIMTKYSSIADVALPSANHQCMNCCGCIRYMVVSSDTEAPAEGKTKETKKKDTSTGESSEATKRVSKPKNVIVPGRFSL